MEQVKISCPAEHLQIITNHVRVELTACHKGHTFFFLFFFSFSLSFFPTIQDAPQITVISQGTASQCRVNPFYFSPQALCRLRYSM